MSDLHGRTQHKVVGKTLLYAISCFASLGVFLVSNLSSYSADNALTTVLKFGYDQG